MIEVGAKAPEFELADHLGRKVSLSQFAGKKHVLLLFYPLDFTPTWSTEVPALEALLGRFQQANTQPLGVSVDSVHCHANWGASLGGVSFPLLADFHPKGEVAEKYSAYLADKGITDRATVLIDINGVVRYAESVTPAGSRDIAALATLCEEFNAQQDGRLDGGPVAGTIAGTLYVKGRCGFSRAALLAKDNLHADGVTVLNVDDDPQSMAALKAATGKEQAPCLVLGDEALLESADIIAKLRDILAPL